MSVSSFGRIGRTTRVALAACVTLSVLAMASPAAPAAAEGSVSMAAPAVEPGAGGWKTFVLRSGSELRPSPPDAAHSRTSMGELAEVVTRQRHLTPEVEAQVRFWSQGAITRPWSEMLLTKILETRPNPVRASRAIALLHVAMYDAAVACWDAKYAYGLASPARTSPAVIRLVPVDGTPSFPSEHATVGAAAAAVLSYLFPQSADQFAAMAAQAGESRIAAGASFPVDVETGRALGAAVGARVVERGQTDNSDAVFTGTVPAGPGLWTPPPSGALLEAMAGSWRPWILGSGGEIAPPPPPVYGSPEYQADIDAVAQVAANLTDEQKRIALFWADGAGTVTPPGHWVRIALDPVDEELAGDAPRAARAMALLGVSQADAFISCWKTKYTYWTARPFQSIPGFTSFIPTPPFPSYTSGHSTQSGAANEVLAYLFPARAAQFRAFAEEAAISRLYGGIHFPSDNIQGLAVGRLIGGRVAEYGRSDGADR